MKLYRVWIVTFALPDLYQTLLQNSVGFWIIFTADFTCFLDTAIYCVCVPSFVISYIKDFSTRSRVQNYTLSPMHSFSKLYQSRSFCGKQYQFLFTPSQNVLVTGTLQLHSWVIFKTAGIPLNEIPHRFPH